MNVYRTPASLPKNVRIQRTKTDPLILTGVAHAALFVGTWYLFVYLLTQR